MYDHPKMIENLKQQIKGKGKLLPGLIGNQGFNKIEKPLSGLKPEDTLLTGGSIFEESIVESK